MTENITAEDIEQRLSAAMKAVLDDLPEGEWNRLRSEGQLMIPQLANLLIAPLKEHDQSFAEKFIGVQGEDRVKYTNALLQDALSSIAMALNAKESNGLASFLGSSPPRSMGDRFLEAAMLRAFEAHQHVQVAIGSYETQNRDTESAAKPSQEP